MMRTLKSGVILSAAIAVISSSASAAEINWTLAYLAVNGTVYEEVAKAIPERIEKATNGRLKITANSSLIKGNRLLEGVRDGLVQMTLPLTGYYTGSQPLFTVPSLPGISESYENMQALSASEYGEQVRELFKTKFNATQLMETAFCPQTLFSTVPIASVEEWKGRKLRVNNRGTGLIGAELGAVTVSLSAGEVLPALERGVIEGVITDSCWAYGAGFQTVISHAANWKLGSVLPSPVLVNIDAWDSLPEDLQTIVRQEFKTLEKEFAIRWKQRADEMPKLWEKAGVNFHNISAGENERVYSDKIQAPVLKAWKKDMKRAGLDADKILAIARKAVK
ncbi:MAG: TRAP transporter substrate-binding protein DctP [Sneathiella sp.]|nr:TRAP transporter substrate-binding protein DctP [Sneathiella sp.]